MQAKRYTSVQLAAAYKNACMAELQALKPGNVHAFADGHGMTIYDFIHSADASAALIAQADFTVGERIFNAVEATQKSVGMNTNLGLVLLCVPIIHAALHRVEAQTLQQSLRAILEQLTIDDARLTAQAIVLAVPAGLGNVAECDVNNKPTISLLAMMQLAESRDRIAWQYSHEFLDIFSYGLARYYEAFARWNNQAWATTALYLGFVASLADSHIVRKYGGDLAKLVMVEAKALEIEYWAIDNPKLIQKKLLAWDASLKLRKINPGTSADLTVATLLVVFLQ
jgi:triphosphoribosyl-dephospho-CoA synthase